jgi:hypothetical protein
MATDEQFATPSPLPDEAQDHHGPHSHGGTHSHSHSHDRGRPHLHLATTSGVTAATFSPGFSILRASIFVRLGSALAAAILIWAAFHWATR